MENVVVYDNLDDEYYTVSKSAGNSFFARQGGMVNKVAEFKTDKEAKKYANEKNKAR